MLDQVGCACSRAKQQALQLLGRLRENARREEGQIERFLTMGIIILIVLAIAAVLYSFRDAVIGVIHRAIEALSGG